jgi:hypothetical protein
MKNLVLHVKQAILRSLLDRLFAADHVMLIPKDAAGIKREFVKLGIILVPLEPVHRVLLAHTRKQVTMPLAIHALQTLMQPQKGSLHAPLASLLLETAVLIVLEFAMLVTSVMARHAQSAQWGQPRAQVTQALVLHAVRVSIWL